MRARSLAVSRFVASSRQVCLFACKYFRKSPRRVPNNGRTIPSFVVGWIPPSPASPVPRKICASTVSA